jgi:8-oxo-dGTP pyrophosphatase MutT (NUDIX family)
MGVCGDAGRGARAQVVGGDTVRTTMKSLPPTPNAGVVVLTAELVLLTSPGVASRHERGVMGLPAGRVDPGEDELGAAIRECEEETGLTLQRRDLTELPERYTAMLDRRDGGTELMTWAVFGAVLFSGEIREGVGACPCGYPVLISTDCACRRTWWRP